VCSEYFPRLPGHLPAANGRNSRRRC
jgi:hypothetical protein